MYSYNELKFCSEWFFECNSLSFLIKKFKTMQNFILRWHTMLLIYLDKVATLPAVPVSCISSVPGINFFFFLNHQGFLNLQTISCVHKVRFDGGVWGICFGSRLI